MNAKTKSSVEHSFGATLLFLFGAIGPWIFIAAFLIEGALRPHYSAWHNVVSSLSEGKDGWTQIANFLVCGALMLGFAFGLRRALQPGKASVWGPILLGMFGISLAGAGIFVTDPLLGYPPGAPTTPTIHGALHVLVSFIAFASLISACFVLARRFAADPAWRSWELYSIITGILVAGFFISSDLASTPSPAAPAGLFQRLAIIAGWSWVALFAARLIRVGPPVEGPKVEARTREQEERPRR